MLRDYLRDYNRALAFLSAADLWFLRSVGAQAQAEGAKASKKIDKGQMIPHQNLLKQLNSETLCCFLYTTKSFFFLSKWLKIRTFAHGLTI